MERHLQLIRYQPAGRSAKMRTVELTMWITSPEQRNGNGQQGT